MTTPIAVITVKCSWMHLSASLRRLTVLSSSSSTSSSFLSRQQQRHRHHPHVALLRGAHPSRQLQVRPAAAAHADSILSLFCVEGLTVYMYNLFAWQYLRYLCDFSPIFANGSSPLRAIYSGKFKRQSNSVVHCTTANHPRILVLD